jgi:hypothetical protein
LASVAGDTVSDPAKSAQFLNVEVNEFSWRRVLIPVDGLRRIEIPQARQACSFENRGHRGSRHSKLRRDLEGGQAATP